MKREVLALFGCFLMQSWFPFLLVGQERASQWRGFRGTDGSAISSDRGLPGTEAELASVVWKKELPGAGGSSPIVVGDKIFLTCYSGYNVPRQAAGDMDNLRRHVLCLDRRSGDVLWNQEVESELPEQPKIRDEHGYATNTPVADDERLYVFFGKTGVLAFTHEGRQLWQANVGDTLSGWGSAASPVLYKDLVIVNASVESQSLVALDKKTGQEKWRAGGINESWNTPLIVPVGGGKTELVVAIFGKVLGIDPDTGKQLWSCETNIGWYMVPSIVAADGVVYCIGGRNTSGGLAVRTGGRGEVTKTHRLWSLNKGSNVSSPVLYEGHLYWMHDNLGIAYCVEAKTGKVVYEERLDRAGQMYASPVLADDKLYYVSRTGRLMVVAAKPKFELLAQTDLDDGFMFHASPAVAGGKLLVRSDRNLYCIGKK